MNKNILKIFAKIQEDFGIEQKELLIERVANEFGMSKHSVRSNWLSRGEIPEYRQEKVLQMAQAFSRELNLNPQV